MSIYVAVGHSLDMTTESHTLADFGSMHVVQIPSAMLSGLSSHYQQTPCNAQECPVGRETPLWMQAMVNPYGGPLFYSKTPNCVLFSTPRRGGPAQKVVSILHSPNMYLPEPGSEPAQLVVLSGGKRDFVLGHEHRPRGVGELSSCSPYNHLLQEVVAMKPLDSTPRVIFEDQGLGTLEGYMLERGAVRYLTQKYLEHLEENRGESHMGFGVEMQLPEEACKLLRVKQPKGRLRMRACANGILLYRTRKWDGKKTLIAVVNSRMTAPGASFGEDVGNDPVQVYKMHYSDVSNDGARIFVRDRPEECRDACDVYAGGYVQEILDVLKHAFGHSHLNSLQCGGFLQLKKAR